MKNRIRRIAAVAVLGLFGIIGYSFYEFYKAGLHTRPEMPEGAFSLSYESGFRAILADVPDEREARRYLGFPQSVPSYLEEVWSFCSPPKADEVGYANDFIETRNMPGERFEVVCKIKADDDVVVRGVITSVPRL